MEYKLLQQGTQDFSTFWARFLKLSQELDYLEATLIDDLIKKCDYTIQERLATGKKNPTDLLKLAKHCQRIKFAIKNLEQNKKLYRRELMQKNKRFVSQNKIIISTLVSSVALMQANFNPAICVL